MPVTLGRKSILLALMVLSLFFHLWQLGSLPLYDYDEAHYATVVRDTIKGGDFWSLKKFGENWVEKPPLLFWLTMGSVKLLGENEFAMRLPSALFGVAAVYGVYLLTLTLTKNFWAAVLSGLILLFSGIFPAAARQLRLDAPLATTIIFGLLSFIRGWKNEKWYPLFWVFLGFGVLLKNLPALLLAPLVLIFSGVFKEWGWFKSRYFWLGLIAFAIIVLPWHIIESIKLGKDFWGVYFIHHIFERAVSPILGGSVTTWSYLKQLLILNEPWFLAALASGLLIFRSRSNFFPEHRLALASLFSALFIFLVFALARTKLIFYLVPLFPLEGVLIASGAGIWYRSVQHRSITGRDVVIVVLAFLTLLGALSTYYQLFISNAPYSYPYVKEEKEIGLLIKNNDKGHALYSFDWSSFDTIYYYSGRKYIERVERSALKTGFKPPYFLIMPRPYLKNTEQPGLAVPFSGQYLILLDAWGPENVVDK